MIGVFGSGDWHGEDALIHSAQNRAKVSKNMWGAVASENKVPKTKPKHQDPYDKNAILYRI